MSGFELSKRQCFSLNKIEYGENYKKIYYIRAKVIEIKHAERNNLILEIKNLGGEFCNNNTKIDSKHLSPGCKLCSQGSWSCLFINGICNGDCFYCPTSQNEVEKPTTNLLTFENPKQFCDYIEYFGFKGVSISGGEPLLTWEKTTSFIQAVKRRFGDKIHFWLYTNGILLTQEKVDRLAQIGLDEIRFDIGATDYSLNNVKLAIGKIKTVTVEIPAVPEKEELLKSLLPEMKRIGVDHLNLHQLRLTPHNFDNLISREYTFLHGPKTAVLESELTALRLVKFSLELDLVPVNYCSFIFKNRFQKMATRKRSAQLFHDAFDETTENGYLRKILFEPKDFAKVKEFLAENCKIDDFYILKNRFLLKKEIIPLLSGFKGYYYIEYYVTRLSDNISYQAPFQKLMIRNRLYFVEKGLAIAPLKLTFAKLKKLLQNDFILADKMIPTSHSKERFSYCYEKVQLELLPYF